MVRLVVCLGILGIFVTYLFCVATSADKSLLMRVLHVVLGSPVSFFDATPVARIIIRFGKDTDSIDDQLPISFTILISNIVAILGAIVGISYIIPITQNDIGGTQSTMNTQQDGNGGFNNIQSMGFGNSFNQSSNSNGGSGGGNNNFSNVNLNCHASSANDNFGQFSEQNDQFGFDSQMKNLRSSFSRYSLNLSTSAGVCGNGSGSGSASRSGGGSASNNSNNSSGQSGVSDVHDNFSLNGGGSAVGSTSYGNPRNDVSNVDLTQDQSQGRTPGSDCESC